MTHRLHVYTGDGPGKTTAAMGLALRGLGHHRQALIAQFMKNGESGELRALAGIAGATVLCAPPMGFTFQMTDEEKRRAAQEQTAFARAVTAEVEALRPGIIVLDELCVALGSGLVDRETAQALVDAALSAGETAVTGRGAPDWLRQRADYVSVIQAEKHPFDTEGLAAREGIEW